MQIPRAMAVVLVVRDTDSRVARDHVIVHGQDGGLLEVHPGDLKERWRKYLIALSLMRTSPVALNQVYPIGKIDFINEKKLKSRGFVSQYREQCTAFKFELLK